MIKPKEILSLAIALIILSFSNSFQLKKNYLVLNSSYFLSSMIFFAVILIFYETGKKFVAYQLGAEEETKIWTFQRYGIYERAYFKNPIPIGIILPFLLSIFSLGMLKWFAVTESSVKPTEARAARKHDFYSFYEMTEWHLALISASGIIVMFILAIIAYLINYPELSRLSIFYAFFNLLPLGKLDGTRIFFGSKNFYAVLVAITLIFLGYAFVLA